MLRELLDALDAMPDKRLIEGDLVTEDGECCTIGALLLHKKVSNPRHYHEWNEGIAAQLDVATCLVQEIEWENDEAACQELPEKRWTRMRKWVAAQIKETA